MSYKMLAPYKNGNIVGFGDATNHDYGVRDGVFEVPDLEVANWFVKERGCRFVGANVNQLANAKTITVTRNQGLGDMLMMTPILRALRKNYPQAVITLATFEIFFDVFLHNPNVDRVVASDRFRADGDGGFIAESDGTKTRQDYWVECNGIAEVSDEVSRKHRTDIFAEVAGFTGWKLDDRRMDYYITQEENERAKALLKENRVLPGDRVLCMATTSTAANRNMPLSKFREVADKAAGDGWKVVLFDRYPENGWDGPGVINLTGKTTVRQMAALMANSTMYFGPDTGAWHLACAVNIPNFVYFGAIDWRLRVSTPKTRAAVRSVQCYPCNKYGCDWAVKKACIDFDSTWLWAQVLNFSNEIDRLGGGTIPGPTSVCNVEPTKGPAMAVNGNMELPTAYMPGRGELVGSTGVCVQSGMILQR